MHEGVLVTTVMMERGVANARPSRLIAEALVHRQGRAELKARAEAMGLGEGLTQVLIRACCKQSPARDAGEGTSN